MDKEQHDEYHLINLHNHSTWSDGLYPPDQMVKAAVVGGLTHIGISDHYYTAKLGAPQFYVDANEVAAYADNIHQLADQYGERIQVLAGLEVDWSPRIAERLDALGPQLEHLDYVLFEYVQNVEWRGNSLDSLLTYLPQVSIPAGLAHNNLTRNFGDRYSAAELVAILEEGGLFVELSTNPMSINFAGTDPYDLRLWELLADSDVYFSVGADAHWQIDEISNVAQAHRFMRERGMLERLITTLWNPVTRSWKAKP
jgi:histidinol phosphatase-like PHP family hydrolase